MEIAEIANLSITSILRTLYDLNSFQREFDKSLCDALDAILQSMQVEFVIARFGDIEAGIIYVPVDFDKIIQGENEFKYIDTLFCDASKRENKSRIYVSATHTHNWVGVDLLLDRKDEYGRNLGENGIADYCIFGEKLSVEGLKFEPYLEKDNGPIVEISYAMNQIFKHRRSLFRHFPSVFAKEYWLSSCRSVISPSSPHAHRIDPPWTGDGLRRTATLSLDMRKSTFAMDLSTDQKAYADWVEAFVLILQKIARDNNGVFDKFTGDGALVHFLADECRRFHELASEDEARVRHVARWRTEASATGQIATRQAVRAGWEMIYGVQHHMKRLSEILGLSSRKVGPAVGIAIDRAQWSVDRDGHLIVVGRGVVQACRITADTPAYNMCLTSHALQMAQEVHGKFSYRTDAFTSKEYHEEVGVEVYRLSSAPEHLCRTRAEIDKVVEQIWGDMDRRAESRPGFNVG